jgi:hypothetical protein
LVIKLLEKLAYYSLDSQVIHILAHNFKPKSRLNSLSAVTEEAMAQLVGLIERLNQNRFLFLALRLLLG